MNAMRLTLLGCCLAAAFSSAALAHSKTIRLRTDSAQTRKWTVFEVTDGQLVSAPAVYNGIGY